MSDRLILTVTREFTALASRVFDAWLDPADARRFLFATPEGEMQQIEIDARVGGKALIVERRAQGAAWADHEPQARQGWTMILDSLARITDKP